VAAVPRVHRTFTRLACASAFAGLSLFPAVAALGDEILATKIVQVNGRPVQEIRLGEVPGSNNLRAVVVTNGPSAGTTSLLTAVGTPEQWLDSAQAAIQRLDHRAKLGSARLERGWDTHGPRGLNPDARDPAD
jgi:hypothetical protein